MGVWIETTTVSALMPLRVTSHPVWVCGLKLETGVQNIGVFLSHPVWVCGLKQKKLDESAEKNASHPVWVCGLKQGVGGRTYPG